METELQAQPVSNEVILEQLKQLQQKLASLSTTKSRQSKADPSRKYVLLSEKLNSWGKIPQQQADLATILSSSMEVGKEYTEPEVFAILNEHKEQFPSLAKSRQTVEYLFRYYRGLKLDGPHAGFVAREFIRG